MSGESQRWLQDEIAPPTYSPARAPRVRIDVGELSAPSASRLSLAGVPEDELRRSLQLDEVFEKNLQAVTLPAGLNARLHALVDQFSD